MKNLIYLIFLIGIVACTKPSAQSQAPATPSINTLEIREIWNCPPYQSIQNKTFVDTITVNIYTSKLYSLTIWKNNIVILHDTFSVATGAFHIDTLISK